MIERKLRMDNAKIMPSFDHKRSVLGEIFPLKTPFNVIVDTSERCNFQCKYCFRSDDDKSKWGYAKDNLLMDWNIFEKIVDQIKQFDDEVRQISLSGHGEPLCNRKIPDMVRYIKQQGIRSRVSIHTNASLLDQEFIADLIDSDIDRIVVSLQGLSSEKYWEVCHAKIDFEQLYLNLRYLYNKKNHTQVHIKVMDVALEKGEEDKFYQMFTPIGDRVFIEQEVPIWKGVDLGKGKHEIENKYGNSFPMQKCCPLIFHTIVIAPNGDVYPCTQLLREDKLGNVNESTLTEMWAGGERRNLLLRQCELNNPEVCEQCYIRQNSIYTKEDMIDDNRLRIKERLENEEEHYRISGNFCETISE